MRWPALNQRLCLFFAGSVLLAGGILTTYLYHLDRENQRAERRDELVREAGAVRAAVEHEISGSLSVALGLVAYVETNPDLTQQSFADIAARIVKHRPYVRNIGLARNNVISHIYPLEGNQAALGFRYEDSASQWPAVARAIEAGNSVIAGPVELVQGGRGLISRIPIYLDDAQTRYWGIASVVIDVDAFFRQVGMEQIAPGLALAIRGKDGMGQAGDVFYGDAALFAREDAALSSVSLPSGSWVLAAYPLDGWYLSSLRGVLIPLLGGGTSLLLAILLYALLNTLMALAQAKRRAELANEVKSRFFSHMTHELRTPLTAIQGAVGLLSNAQLQIEAAQKAALLDNAARNCARLNWIINDVLDLKRLEAGGMSYAFEPCAVPALIGDAIDAVAQYARQYHTRIEVDSALGNDVWVNGDAHRLQQVLTNLLSNAIKYSPEHSTVTLHALLRGDYVRIEVVDQGEGVSEDKIEDIFNEFSQDKATAKRNIASTGLGLSISKLIVQQHLGTIGVYNLPDGGCVFFIELPQYEGPTPG